jgi:hypothetical protein
MQTKYKKKKREGRMALLCERRKPKKKKKERKWVESRTVLRLFSNLRRSKLLISNLTSET